MFLFAGEIISVKLRTNACIFNYRFVDCILLQNIVFVCAFSFVFAARSM